MVVRANMGSLVLLPGMMCDDRLWSPQIEALSPLVDEIFVADFSVDDSIAGMARTVLASAPAKFALAGLSMGGIVALEMWRQAPDRITGMALMDTNARAELSSRRAKREPQIQRAEESLWKVVDEELIPSYAAEGTPGHDFIGDVVREMADSLGQQVFRQQSIALRDRADSVRTLRSITCPVLVLGGTGDKLCPASNHEFIHRSITGSKLILIPNCGHLSTLECPEAVNKSLADWLQVVAQLPQKV